jgi:hypothetical protein
MLTLFKLKKEPMYIPDEEHQIVYELLYPNEDEEDC